MKNATVFKSKRKNSKYVNWVLNFPKVFADASNFADKQKVSIFPFGDDAYLLKIIK